MICPKCMEEDPTCFFEGTCRRCIASQFAKEPTITHHDTFENAPIQLTPFQQSVSNELIRFADTESVFIDAVCGAGKTEICLGLIEAALQKGKHIAWVIPRREVVLEIKQRLSFYYPLLKVIAVCEGHLEEFEGDIVVATAHQMFRYYQRFDLVILDEPDAFPFRGNRTLYNYLKVSCRGTIVYLSATFELDHVRKLSLSIRPSLVLLPVPTVICSQLSLITMLKDLNKVRHEMCLIFVPTKKIARYLSFLLKCSYVTSSSKHKKETIEAFRAKRDWLVTTTVLERGVTFIDCFVFVYRACHKVFDEGSLVQIAGRAMRGMNPKKGSVSFYCTEYTTAIKKSCQRIKDANTDASYVLSQVPKSTF